METPSAIPLDVAQIHWDSCQTSRFEVQGQGSIESLTAANPAATVETMQQAQVGQDLAENKVVVLVTSGVQVRVGGPSAPALISGHFELQFFFTVGNLAELQLTVEGQSETAIHPQLTLLLASVAYSTARGILWTRLMGTPLEGVSLPIIDPRALFATTPDPKAAVQTSK